jgi:hypothetical protein
MMMYYRPVVWLGARRAQVERLCQALRRYCEQVLGDPSAIVDVVPDEEMPDMLIVPIVASSAFKKLPETERLKSIFEFLSKDPEVTREDWSGISRYVIRAD